MQMIQLSKLKLEKTEQAKVLLMETVYNYSNVISKPIDARLDSCVLSRPAKQVLRGHKVDHSKVSFEW